MGDGDGDGDEDWGWDWGWACWLVGSLVDRRRIGFDRVRVREVREGEEGRGIYVGGGGGRQTDRQQHAACLLLRRWVNHLLIESSHSFIIQLRWKQRGTERSK